ncbi:MAG: hypothetical protein AAFW60_08375, partial [Pseudomonadota bacterium]
KHPGYEVDIRVEADIRRFVEAWRGLRPLREEIAKGTIRLEGPKDLRRAFPDWLLLSALSPYPRLREGSERQMTQAAPTEAA